MALYSFNTILKSLNGQCVFDLLFGFNLKLWSVFLRFVLFKELQFIVL